MNIPTIEELDRIGLEAANLAAGSSLNGGNLCIYVEAITDAETKNEGDVESIVRDLLAAGWEATADAQHEKIKHVAARFANKVTTKLRERITELENTLEQSLLKIIYFKKQLSTALTPRLIAEAGPVKDGFVRIYGSSGSEFRASRRMGSYRRCTA